MAKPNLGVKISGNGLRSQKVLDDLRKEQQTYSVAVIVCG